MSAEQAEIARRAQVLSYVSKIAELEEALMRCVIDHGVALADVMSYRGLSSGGM